MFQRIMAATENPTFCDEKIKIAASLSDKCGATLSVLHVLESTSSMYRNFVRHYKTGEEIVRDADYEEEVRKEIETRCGELLKGREILIRDGFPWEEIVKLERKRNADLIVLGPHQASRKPPEVKRTAGKIGTTTEGVVQRARCPVMLVNGPVSEKKLAFKTVLVAVDYSVSCGLALKLAHRIATECGAKTYAFHMVSPEAERASGKDASERQKELAEFCVNIEKGFDAQYVVAEGERPHLEILRFARDKDIDLIAMGSHTKRNKDGDWVSGSVAQGVGALSDCPVIVVTDPRALRSR